VTDLLDQGIIFKKEKMKSLKNSIANIETILRIKGTSSPQDDNTRDLIQEGIEANKMYFCKTIIDHINVSESHFIGGYQIETIFTIMEDFIKKNIDYLNQYF